MSTLLQELVDEVSRYITESNLQGGGDARFNELALKIFAFQFEKNLPYRKYCQGLGRNPANVTRWDQAPAVVTSAFKEVDLTIFAGDEWEKVFHSSGTTEQKPSRHFHNKKTLGLYEHSLLSWFKPHFGLIAGKKPFLFLTPSPGEAPHSSLVHMFSTLGCDLATGYLFASHANADGSWTIDEARVLDFLKAQSEPLIVCGTAFSFVHFYDAAGAKKFPLPQGSLVLETGGYKGRSREVAKTALHEMISEMFAVKRDEIICEYGMSELSSQAYARSGTNGADKFQFPPWARCQIVSPESGKEVGEGEPGLVRVFDLANVGSVMAIQIEDLGVKHGNGFDLLGRAAASEARGCSLMAA